MKKNKKSLRIGGIALLCVVFVAAAAGVMAWRLVFSSVGKNEQTCHVYIKPGTTYEEFVRELNHEVGMRHPSIFRIIARYKHFAERMHPGRYAVTPGMQASELMNAIMVGRQEPVKLTIHNIRTQEELVRLLRNRLMPDSTAFVAALTDSAVCADVGMTPETVRCLFLPDTYEVLWTITPRELLAMMKRYYDAYWTPERCARADSIGLTPIQVATMASIVEEESGREDEHARIAGLYINRLHKGMKLQADPTVKFALGDFTIRRILHEHLQVASPYNTYHVVGLPPAPIRLAMKNTMNRVLHYEHHDYLYMCAKEDFSGHHNFAADYATHKANARRYQQALNERNIR